jgi:hypothetical protein
MYVLIRQKKIDTSPHNNINVSKIEEAVAQVLPTVFNHQEQQCTKQRENDDENDKQIAAKLKCLNFYTAANASPPARPIIHPHHHSPAPNTEKEIEVNLRGKRTSRQTKQRSR